MWRYISWTGKWLYVWWDHIQYDWFGNISFPLYYKVCVENFKVVVFVCGSATAKKSSTFAFLIKHMMIYIYDYFNVGDCWPQPS